MKKRSRQPPRLPFSLMRTAAFFYLSLAVVQLVFYFLSPSFYVSDPSELIIPNFIKWAFAKEILLIFLLYALWGIFWGACFFLGTKIFGPRKTLVSESLLKPKENTIPHEHPPEEISLPALQLQADWDYWSEGRRGIYWMLLLQLTSCWLLLAWKYPSILHQYPYTRDYPILFSFAGLASLILFFSFIFLLRRTHQAFYKNFTFLLAGLALPLLIIQVLTLPTPLNLVASKIPTSSSPDKNDPNILILGFDALSGEDGAKQLQPLMQQQGGVLFRNAFTPLPLTHPAWNSILSGLYPPHHQVRYFFDSPYPSKYPELYLPKLLKQKGYASLFASDQPETSYFDQTEGFNDQILKIIGWRAHLQNTLFNHFVFPALWLNNQYTETLTGYSWNFANLFNFEPTRFFNYTSRKFADLPSEKKFLSLHTCFLHTPIQLTGEEARRIPDYWWLAPKNFFFQKWPKSGEKLQNTPANWVMPYPYRRASTFKFLNALLQELNQKGYFQNSIVVFLSDHGERFIEKREFYGGVHGVDIETREQMNVLFAWMEPGLREFRESATPVSLVDIAPTVLQRIGLNPQLYPFDGVALLNADGELTNIPERPIWIESMGYLDHSEDQVEFPQIGVKTLEKSLSYHANGAVTIGEDYYQKILPKKLIQDATKSNLLLNKPQ